jgi:hypothetical protein
MDRLLKSNSSKSRTHSLFRQGYMLHELIPNMPENRRLSLMRFAEMPVSSGLLGGFLSALKTHGSTKDYPGLSHGTTWGTYCGACSAHKSINEVGFMPLASSKANVLLSSYLPRQV